VVRGQALPGGCSNSSASVVKHKSGSVQLDDSGARARAGAGAECLTWRRAPRFLAQCLVPPLPCTGRSRRSRHSPEDRVARKRAYESAVEGMRFEDRIVLEMSEVDGYEKPEIAAALDIPEGTVASRLRRARDHLAAAGGRIGVLAVTTVHGIVEMYVSSRKR